MLPACAAVIVVVPAPVIVTVLPEIVATAVLLDVSATARFDVVIAEISNGASRKVLVGRESNVMIWFAFVTVILVEI